MASTSAAAIAWSELPVRTSIPPHVARAEALIKNVEEALESLGAVAAMLKAAGQDDKVQQVRESARQMLAARESARLQREALAHLATSYHASGATTDFAATLAAKRDALMSAQPYAVEEDPLMLEFEELAAEVEAAAQEEQIDDDIAIEGGAELAKNTTCPITGKTMLDLKEPVADAVGFVYEREAVEAYIRQKLRGQVGQLRVACPVAGTSSTIALGELRPAKAVLAAQRRAASGRGAPAKRQDAGDVVDLE